MAEREREKTKERKEREESLTWERGERRVELKKLKINLLKDIIACCKKKKMRFDKSHRW